MYWHNKQKISHIKLIKTSHPPPSCQIPITNRTIDKIKVLLNLNREQYSLNDTNISSMPVPPPRSKRPTKNSIAPSNDSEIKIISSTMRSNGAQSQMENENDKINNHIWHQSRVFHAQKSNSNFYNIPNYIPYYEWPLTHR